MFGRSRSLVGLDIGDSSVKVVELKELGKGRGFQVAKLGWEPLSAEAIVDGAIMDSQLVIETIQRLIQRCRIKTQMVATGVLVARKRRAWEDYDSEEIHRRLHERYDTLEPAAAAS